MNNILNKKMYQKKTSISNKYFNYLQLKDYFEKFDKEIELKLSERQQEIYNCKKKFNCYSLSEVAEITGIPRGAVVQESAKIKKIISDTIKNNQ